MQIPTTAVSAATDATREQLQNIFSIINNQFGDEYAKKNPALVAALVQTAAYNLRTQIQSGVYGR